MQSGYFTVRQSIVNGLPPRPPPLPFEYKLPYMRTVTGKW